MVAFDSDLVIRHEIDRVLASRHAEPHVVMEFDNIETIKRAVEIETLRALAEVEPLTRLAAQLWELKSRGANALRAYVRNVRLSVFEKAQQVFVEAKK